MPNKRQLWEGPLPWLVYLTAYGIPWVWTPPTTITLLVSGLAMALFVGLYLLSFRLRGVALAAAVVAMTGIGVVLAPLGGGWTVFAVYPAMQAATLRPPRAAVALLLATLCVFLAAGFLLGQPLVWWLPGLMVPALLGGAVLSREAFFDRTQALLAAQEEVRRLAVIAERERMARDLHDTAGRTFTLIALKADLVSRSAEDPVRARVEALSIAAVARAGLEEVGLALEGRVGGSLTREIRASCEALKAAGVSPHVMADASRVPPAVAAVLAMTLREAVTNVIRHAEASRCEIELDQDATGAVLTVSDDGVGGPVNEGHGLTGMRQRLVAAGGALQISSGQRGAIVRASMPA